MFLPSLPVASAWKLVTRPVLRLGAALLLGGTLATSFTTTHTTGSYRLLLATDSDPACVYGSAWNDGDVLISHDASDGKVVTLTSRYDFEDGCTWEATETLTPEGRGYAYEYSEQVVSCQTGAIQGVACARRGHVAVVANAR